MLERAKLGRGVPRSRGGGRRAGGAAHAVVHAAHVLAQRGRVQEPLGAERTLVAPVLDMGLQHKQKSIWASEFSIFYVALHFSVTLFASSNNLAELTRMVK